MTKKTLTLLIIFIVAVIALFIVLGFVIVRHTFAPASEKGYEFRGPTSAPYVKGPTSPPPGSLK